MGIKGKLFRPFKVFRGSRVWGKLHVLGVLKLQFFFPMIPPRNLRGNQQSGPKP